MCLNTSDVSQHFRLIRIEQGSNAQENKSFHLMQALTLCLQVTVSTQRLSRLKKKEIPPATAPNSCPKEWIGIADSFKNTSFGVGVPFQEAMMDDYQEKMQTRTEQRNYIVFDSNQHRPESQSECDRNLSRYSSVWYLLTCLEQPPVISNGGCDCCDLSSILEQTNL